MSKKSSRRSECEDGDECSSNQRRRLNNVMDRTHRELIRIIAEAEGGYITEADSDNEETESVDLSRDLLRLSLEMRKAEPDYSDPSVAGVAAMIIEDVVVLMDLIIQGQCPREGHKRLVEIACIAFSTVTTGAAGTSAHTASDSLWKVVRMDWDLVDATKKCSCPCDDCKPLQGGASMRSIVSSVAPLIPSTGPEDDGNVFRLFAPDARLEFLPPLIRHSRMHQTYDDDDEDEEYNSHVEDEDEENVPPGLLFGWDETNLQQNLLPILRANLNMQASAATAASMWGEVVATDNGNGQFTAIFGISRFGGRDARRPDVLRINVERDDLLVSTFKSLECLESRGDLDAWSRSRTPSISVKFVEESGYGEGVMRDWITCVMKAIYSPETGIFAQVGHRVVHPRRADSLDERLASVATPSKWGWLAGFVTGIAARANVSTGYHLSDAFASLVLGRRPSDLEASTKEVEDDVAKVCKRTMDADPDDLSSMGLTFEYEDSGLLPDGSGQGIQVNIHNRALFTKLVSARVCGTDDVHGLPASIGREFQKGFTQGLGYKKDASMSGLWYVAVGDFNEAIGGRLELTPDDILSRVKFSHGRNVNQARAEELVKSFKQHVRDMTEDDRRSLLRFWTGSLAPPVGKLNQTSQPNQTNATNMQMVVVEDHGEGRRPYSHTCYQQLTVPMAESVSETLTRLDESIANCEAIVD